MKLNEALKKITKIRILRDCKPVDLTIAELVRKYSDNAEIQEIDSIGERSDFCIASEYKDFKKYKVHMDENITEQREWSFFRISENGEGILLSSRTNYFYGFITYIIDKYLNEDLENFEKGIHETYPFKWHRSIYDVFIAQTARTNRSINPEDYFRDLAVAGTTHVEVNGLAFPEPIEKGVNGEVYPRFYTYCAALDQFSSSELNKGVYPEEYVKANLENLKKNAHLALKYGITPGLLCFEPRSVPEEFLERYPVLRGARVDHPLRSLKPRYNLAVCHPVVKEHYKELIQNLLKEVPELGYVSIWTNDSGAGFELTKSLYVGPNTSGYLIREWKSDEDNAKAAADNAVNFLNLLRDSAREINPEFRVITRREPFYGEEKFLNEMLNEGIDFEVFSHLSKGFESSYNHPVYKDVTTVLGTLFQSRLKKEEKTEIDRFKKQGVDTHIIYAPGTMNNFEPLLGIPFPRFVFERLKSMVELNLDKTIFYGGGTPNSLAPYNINQEIVKLFLYGGIEDIDQTIEKMAAQWADKNYAEKLVQFWKLTEEGIKHYQPVFLYSLWGITWYRLWIRPIVPDFEKIPERDRKYYEDIMLTTPHNPTRVDLNRDVGFTLMSLDFAKNAVERIDSNVWEKLDGAIKLADLIISSNPERNVLEVFVDQRDRVIALKCWIRTIKNTCAWIYNVHTYLKTDNKNLKNECRKNIREMVLDEIENAKDLLNLLETSEVEFMQISGDKQTTFIYDENIGQYIKKKIELMQGRENDEPSINNNIIWTVWENK